MIFRSTCTSEPRSTEQPSHDRFIQEERIVNDPNDWADEVGDPRYILDLLCRIVTVSIETMKIVDALPRLEIADQIETGQRIE